MNRNPIQCYTRSKELLSLLKEHGPLSTRALIKMVDPPMTKRRIRESLSRLVKKGFVSQRLESVFGGAGTYYQIGQKPSIAPKIAKFLECSPESIYQPEFRYRELLHTECAALWSDYFYKTIPGVNIIRDFEFSQNESAIRVMNIDRNDFDVRPDLLLLIPAPGLGSTVNVAVEIEKTMKSKKRMRKKISKYALGARVDGVIYICDSEATEESIMQVFKGRIHQKSKNIRAYSDHFFMFCKERLPSKEKEPILNNVTSDTVELMRWFSFLQANPKNLRRDEHLKVQQSGAGLS